MLKNTQAKVWICENTLIITHFLLYTERASAEI